MVGQRHGYAGPGLPARWRLIGSLAAAGFGLSVVVASPAAADADGPDGTETVPATVAAEATPVPPAEEGAAADARTPSVEQGLATSAPVESHAGDEGGTDPGAGTAPPAAEPATRAHSGQEPATAAGSTGPDAGDVAAAEAAGAPQDSQSAASPTEDVATPATAPEPSAPAPSESAPSQPTPSETAPSEPTPSEPTPSQPGPADPVPTEEVPSAPAAPGEAHQQSPAPSQPAPSQPATPSPRPAAPAAGPEGQTPVPAAAPAATSVRPTVSVVATGTAPAVLSAVGWANPAAGRLTSDFGARKHPVLGTFGLHAGQDIANSCGTPVHAAAAGTVIWAGGALHGRTGNQVVIAHGGGIVTRYGHLLTGSVTVRQGDTVVAGQRIAGMGGDHDIDPIGAGNSTGCHLHLEVNTNAGLTPVDPRPWFAQRGIALGTDEPGVVRGGGPVSTAQAAVWSSDARGDEDAAPEADDAHVPLTLDDVAAAIDGTFETHRVPILRQLG